ncbi:MAG: FAD-binding oxidoreductase [Candidatus Methylomirabilales bacterium]
MADLTQQLAQIVGAQYATGPDGYAVDGLVPQAVVRPDSPEEVAAIMRYATEHKLAVSPWGGGTQMGLGAPPERIDLILDVGRLHRVIEHEPADTTVVIQAGARLQAVQAHLGQSRQFLPLETPNPERATLGGILATNASGPRRLRYGSARDLLIGIRVVQADGRIIKGGAKVVKNVTGYDMNKLFIGSLGTLGILVETIFRVYPLQAVERTWLAEFSRAEEAADAAHRLTTAPLAPTALELINPKALAQVAAATGIPWPPGTYALAVAIGSVVDEAVEGQFDAVRKICAAAGARGGFPLAEEHHRRFWQAVRDFRAGAKEGLSATLKASVLLTRVAEAVRMGEEIAMRQRLDCAIVAEAGSGVVRYYLRGDHSPSVFAPALGNALGELRPAIARGEGTVVVLDAPVEAKRDIDVWGPVKGLRLMRQLKEQFDPLRILNPGRFVGGI